jgi:phage gp29-like protein
MSTQPDDMEMEMEVASDVESSTYDEVPDEEAVGFDMAELMASLLATPEGDTVCSALVQIANQIQTQNKILIKVLAQLQKMA